MRILPSFSSSRPSRARLEHFLSNVRLCLECMKAKEQPVAASREGAGFRQAFTASRCPKPRRGEEVAPAPVGVPVGQSVSRRRSARQATERNVSLGPFSAPLWGPKAVRVADTAAD